MSQNDSTRIRLLKRQARAVLRDLRSDDAERVENAAQRFLTLRSFAAQSQDQLRQQLPRVRLKHALALIAESDGFASWNALLDAHNDVDDISRHIEASRDAMYVTRISALVNRWFPGYEEASESLRDMGGCLLPYRHQFYVTECSAVSLLGLDPSDADWQKIGWDWVAPRDPRAWSRLWRQRQAVIAAAKADAR